MCETFDQDCMTCFTSATSNETSKNDKTIGKIVIWRYGSGTLMAD